MLNLWVFWEQVGHLGNFRYVWGYLWMGTCIRKFMGLSLARSVISKRPIVTSRSPHLACTAFAEPGASSPAPPSPWISRQPCVGLLPSGPPRLPTLVWLPQCRLLARSSPRIHTTPEQMVRSPGSFVDRSTQSNHDRESVSRRRQSEAPRACETDKPTIINWNQPTAGIKLSRHLLRRRKGNSNLSYWGPRCHQQSNE
jgi:hypothetical protein